MERTTIVIEEDGIKKLNKYQRKGMSYTDVILWLAQEVERCEKERDAQMM